MPSLEYALGIVVEGVAEMKVRFITHKPLFLGEHGRSIGGTVSNVSFGTSPFILPSHNAIYSTTRSKPAVRSITVFFALNGQGLECGLRILYLASF